MQQSDSDSRKPFLYLAPMRGFTDVIFRNVYVRHFSGVDMAMAPFLATVGQGHCNRKIFGDLLPEKNGHLPVVPQVLSNDAQAFINMAHHLHELGYTHVNWNLGCPYPMVANKKRGSGLLPHPELIAAFLDRVVPVIPMQLSIKTRLGRFRKNEIEELIPIFNRYPLKEIIIHPRIGKQMYTGSTDLEAFIDCTGALNHTVVYNGDIVDTRTFEHHQARLPDVNRWMLGRGVLANPFLPVLIKNGAAPVKDRVAQLKRFHDDLMAAYGRRLQGPGHLLNKMKGYWTYWARPFANGRKLVKKVHKANSLQAYQAATTLFLDSDAGWNEEIEVDQTLDTG